MDQWITRRQKIIELLSNSDYPISLDRIAEILDILDKKVILEDLSHINKTIGRYGNKLLVTAPKCIDCGFIFDNKFKIPSKCPNCKKSRIYSPQFKII